MMPEQKNLKSRVRSLIEDLVANSETNTLGYEHTEESWSKPLVGFSAANDAYYQFFKEDIGSFYWLPEEAFQLAFSDIPVSADQLTVISWIIPQTKATKKDQRREIAYPSERWARSRLFGEEFNQLMRRYIADELTIAGYPALAPMLLPAFQRKTSEKFGYASSWSERHAAFVAGLGTFGLSDGLITPVGKAIRCGSVIAKMEVEPDPRPYDDHNLYCLFHFDGSCKKCGERCPVDAIDEHGHDKTICHDYIRQTTTPYTEKNFQLKITSCGLCQSKVPCESGIPPKIRNRLHLEC
jgi:ferredoxin